MRESTSSTGVAVLGSTTPDGLLVPDGATPTPRASRLWLLVLAVAVAMAGTIYHPPYLVIEPGPSFDITDEITITGVSAHRPTGRYLITTVRVSRANLWRTAWDALRPGRDVEKVSGGGSGSFAAAVPAAVASSSDDWERAQFAASRQLAAVAAARANGLSADVTGTGATVLGLVAATPASAVLRPGDTIVAVDGATVETVWDLDVVVRGRPAGWVFTLTVDRDGDRLDLSVRSSDGSNLVGRPSLGLFVATRDVRAVLPFQIRFADLHDIGGPSAGLAYALAINDMLDPTDDAQYRSIAATGTIDANGRVGDVGGVAEKIVGAQAAGADLFIVPDASLHDLAAATITVGGVGDLTDALRLLLPV